MLRMGSISSTIRKLSGKQKYSRTDWLMNRPESDTQRSWGEAGVATRPPNARAS
jgi:hypothetical protein